MCVCMCLCVRGCMCVCVGGLLSFVFSVGKKTQTSCTHEHYLIICLSIIYICIYISNCKFVFLNMHIAKLCMSCYVFLCKCSCGVRLHSLPPTKQLHLHA